MKNEDYYEMYNKWKNSQKNKQFQEKLKYNKMMAIEKDIKKMREVLKKYFDYYSIQENIDGEIYSCSSDLIDTFRTHIISLSMNQKYYEVRQEFEICDDIYHLIKYKVKVCEYLWKKFFSNYLDKEEGEIEQLEILNMQEVVWSVIDEGWDNENNKLKK